MKIQQIKAGLYSTYMRVKGYNVLQNPQNTPPTVVRAIKYYRGINPATLDTFEIYERVTKNFDKKNPQKTEEYFLRDRFAFFNREKKDVKYKEQVMYNRFSTDGKNVTKHKSQVTDEEIDGRDFSYINQPSGKIRESNIELARDNEYVSPDSIETIGESVVDRYFRQIKTKSYPKHS